MVDVHKSIAQIGIDVVHRLFDVLVVWVIEHKLAAVVVRVVGQVKVFVEVADLVKPSVGLQTISLVCQVDSKIDFELLQEWLRLFHEEVEFGDFVGVLLC